MPRIKAGTVAHNRSMRQASLVAAAHDIAADAGVAAVTVAAVAKRAGIARSSVYEYFDSAADLLSDVLIDELIEMCEALHAAVKGLCDPAVVIERWIRASLDYIADGRHALVRSAGQVELPAHKRELIGGLHRQMADPLVAALAAVGVRNAPRAAQQVAAVLEVAVRRVESGADAAAEASAAVAFALGGLARTGSPTSH